MYCRAEPYLRVLHPAVVMDLSLLTPASKPVPEVGPPSDGAWHSWDPGAFMKASLQLPFTLVVALAGLLL